MSLRPMRETQRRRLMNRALKESEAKAESKIASMLNQRFGQLKRELRRANLRKRLAKAERDNKPQEEAPGIDWTTWITLFAMGLQNALLPIAESVHTVEETYWMGRGQSLDPLNYDSVLSSYEARTGRQISQIGLDTRNAVLGEITRWYNSQEPLPELIDKLSQYFSPERAAMIAHTESVFIASEVTRETMEQLGIQQFNVDLGVDTGLWPCQRCIDQADANPHAVGDEMPPFHPRCRCGVSYLVNLEGT